MDGYLQILDGTVLHTQWDAVCVGSGTTAIAAINAECRVVCFETAPAFYVAASERIRAAHNET